MVVLSTSVWGVTGAVPGLELCFGLEAQSPDEHDVTYPLIRDTLRLHTLSTIEIEARRAS